jgi:Mce-associated membrane protein
VSVTQESAPEGLPAPDRPDEDTPGPGPHSGVLDVVRRFRGPLLLLAVTVLLAAVGGWLFVQAPHERSGTNQALVDTAATNRVIGDVSGDIDQIFSYSYNDIGATRRAAATVLTGRAAGQYTTLFGQIRQHAAAQRLTLTSRVVSAGVTRLDGDHAQLLVFLDQTTTRGDTGRTSAAAAQLSISAELVAGHWVIDDMHAR